MAMTKTHAEIEAMRRGGALLSRALQAAVDAVRPGVTMRELDAIATRVIEEGGGTPSFKGYAAGGGIPFPSTMCISRNNEIVHGLGNRDVALAAGDIVGLDIGLWLDGLCTDMAVTVPVGTVNAERLALMRATRDAMEAGVDAAKTAKTVADISGAIEDATDMKRYGIVTSLVGHGVGHKVHEPPHVPNYRAKNFPTVRVVPGMCLAIEPMLTTGKGETKTADDGWTIETVDGSDAAHFEVTIAITEQGVEVLTPQPNVNI
ncbi:type I methionyl aminopeptidase [Candidatus Uhrbacteria bacterium]|nr:type I methionyl aminopeptidase [Candidatus Uhrbacteria bacterium]